jgi:hypothetical protein
VGIDHGRPKNQGRRVQYEKNARSSTRGNKKGGYTTTSRSYGSHFGSVVGMCRSGDIEGPTKGPAIETQTHAGTSSKDHWIIGHFSRCVQTRNGGSKEQAHRTNLVGCRGDSSNIGRSFQRGRGH